MSIQQLKMLREQAWIPTPIGEQFSLHFDEDEYLRLIAQHILDQVAAFSCKTSQEGGVDLYADGYEAGYNAAVVQVVAQLRVRYE